MKIVVLDGASVMQNDLNFELLNEICEVVVYRDTRPDEVVSRIADAEIVLTNKVNIDKTILDACKNLNYICVLATGYNGINCAYAREKGVHVSNVPNYSTQSVVQHTFALLLEFCARVDLHSRAVERGEWVAAPQFCFCKSSIIELENKTFGIIGYGNIGKAVKVVAEAFGMKVLVATRTKNENCVSIDTVFANSDIISLHCPLNDESAEFIRAESLEKMKDGVILINTARGGLVRERDIADALKSGKIAGYLADVLSTEPPCADNPLLHAKNCILTPHIAWASVEARRRLLAVTKKNIEAFLNNTPINLVN